MLPARRLESVGESGRLVLPGIAAHVAARQRATLDQRARVWTCVSTGPEYPGRQVCGRKAETRHRNKELVCVPSVLSQAVPRGDAAFWGDQRGWLFGFVFVVV